MLDLVNLLATMQRALSIAACALLLAFAAAPFVTVITLSYACLSAELRLRCTFTAAVFSSCRASSLANLHKAPNKRFTHVPKSL